jgi:hypothetical protein
MRIIAAAGTANEKVLLHPNASPRAVRASETVGSTIFEFHRLLGLESNREALEARRWSSAAGEVRDRAIETGSEGIGAVRRGGSVAVARAREGAGGARRSVQALPGRLRSGRGRTDGERR